MPPQRFTVSVGKTMFRRWRLVKKERVFSVEGVEPSTTAASSSAPLLPETGPLPDELRSYIRDVLAPGLVQAFLKERANIDNIARAACEGRDS